VVFDTWTNETLMNPVTGNYHMTKSQICGNCSGLTCKHSRVNWTSTTTQTVANSSGTVSINKLTLEEKSTLGNIVAGSYSSYHNHDITAVAATDSAIV